MTNREAYKDTLDTILAKAIAVVGGKPEPCATASCKRCLFLVNCREHEIKKEVIDWLNAEYQEPSVDWSKVPIDSAMCAELGLSVNTEKSERSEPAHSSEECEDALNDIARLKLENQQMKESLIEYTVKSRVMTEQYNTLLERFCNSGALTNYR